MLALVHGTTFETAFFGFPYENGKSSWMAQQPFERAGWRRSAAMMFRISSHDEDSHLWLKLMAAGAKPVHLSGTLFWYRRSAEGRQQQVQKDRALKQASAKKMQETANAIKMIFKRKNTHMEASRANMQHRNAPIGIARYLRAMTRSMS
ncbi:MAG: hypothetical protein ACLR4Z_09590 [Butyricicoccaceae bacterium]